MSPHVRLDIGGTAALDCCAHGALEFRAIDNRSLEHTARRRPAALTAQHDDAVTWIAHSLSEDHGLARMGHDGVGEIRVAALIVADYRQGFAAVGKHDDLMRKREKWDLRMRSETTLARQGDSSLWMECESCVDFGPGRIELRARARDVM
jgi:hypothetical protein